MTKITKPVTNFGVILIYLAVFGVFIFLQVFAVLFFDLTAIDLTEANVQTFGAITTLFMYITMTVLLIYYLRIYLLKNQLPIFFQRIHFSISLIFLGLFLMFMTSLLAGAFMQAIGIEGVSDNQAAIEAMLGAGWYTVLMVFIFSVFLAPIVEELVFRKAIFGLVTEKTGNLAAIFISAFFFALIHVITDPIMILSYFPLGLVLGFMYYYSGKVILVPIFMHFGWNLFAITVALLVS